MIVRNYQGFESLKEVECSGTTLPNEVRFLSLTMYKKVDFSEEVSLAFMETSAGSYSCHTFTEFSSCTNDASNIQNSVVKTLVSDLEGGERTHISCNISAVFKIKSEVYKGSWDIDVYRESKDQKT